MHQRIHLVTGTVICFYFLSILFFASNFPINDDFSIVDSLNRLLQSDSFIKQTETVFSQHNEHRPATTRIIFMAYHKLFGEINFVHLALFGNLAIVGIYFIFMRQITDNNEFKKYLSLIVACLLFQYGSAENMIWAMGSNQNYYLLLFVFLTLTCLTKNHLSYFFLAILFAILATFTQGNGLLAFVVGGIYILTQKQYRNLFVWLSISIVTIVLYFHGYQTPSYHSDPLLLLSKFGNVTLYALAFMGSCFGVGGSHYPTLRAIFLVPSTTLGLGLFLATIFFIYKKKHLDGSILIWINLFIIITAFIIATARIDYGIGQALTSRYHINSAILLTSTILIFSQYINYHPANKFVTKNRSFRLISLLFVTYTFITFPVIYYYSSVLFEPAKNGGIIFPDKTKAREILDQAQSNGVFMKSQTF